MSDAPDNTPREEILSREETDALLQGIEDGSVQTSQGHGRPPGEVRLYDFGDCERLARGSMPTLEVINTRIARKLEKQLSDLLRKPVEATCAPCQTTRLAEFMPTLPMPSSLNLVRLRPLQGTVLIVPSQRLVLKCVDCFFGGKGVVGEDIQPRELTAVEQRLVARVLERFLSAFHEGWKPVIELTADVIGHEQNPHFAAIANSGDRVLVHEFTVTLCDESATLQLVMPRAMLEPVAEALNTAPRNDAGERDEAWSRALRRRFRDAPLEIGSTLTQTTLRLGDVLALQPGDVVPVEMPDEIVLAAAGTPLFRGRAGSARNRNAIEVTGRAGNDNDERITQ